THKSRRRHSSKARSRSRSPRTQNLEQKLRELNALGRHLQQHSQSPSRSVDRGGEQIEIDIDDHPLGEPPTATAAVAAMAMMIAQEDSPHDLSPQDSLQTLMDPSVMELLQGVVTDEVEKGGEGIGAEGDLSSAQVLEHLRRHRSGRRGKRHRRAGELEDIGDMASVVKRKGAKEGVPRTEFVE
ncbi:hypothetical protein HK102_011709, partial [Quaeritorhiza haematococci]